MFYLLEILLNEMSQVLLLLMKLYFCEGYFKF